MSDKLPPRAGRPTERRPVGEFGRRLRALREAQGLTLEAAAERITAAGFPVGFTTLRRLETEPDPEYLARLRALAAAYGATPAELFDAPAEAAQKPRRRRA